MRSNQKVSPKYFGPYKIIELHVISQIHHVFHVSQLKVLVGNVHTSTQLPTIVQDVFLKEPERILERKMVNRQGKTATMVLVKLTNLPVEEATWKFLYDLAKKFPTFELRGQGFLNREDLL